MSVSKHGKEGGQGETRYESKLPFVVLVCPLERLECHLLPVSNWILKSAYSSFLHSEQCVCVWLGGHKRLLGMLHFIQYVL